MPRAHQVHEETNRARHSCRQLTEECVARIDVSALSIFRLNHSALLIGFARVVAGGQRLEMIVPVVHEIKPARLHPTVKVVLRNFTWIMKDWMLGTENCYGRFFDGCARAAQVCRIRRQMLTVEIAD